MAVKYEDMAIGYKKLKKKIETDPLNEEELALIKSREDFIDEKIKSNFGTGYFNEVSIELGYATFQYDLPGETGIQKHKSARLAIMQKELEKRYIKAGWVVETHFDDGLDGPNRSGPDYWVLKGKN